MCWLSQRAQEPREERKSVYSSSFVWKSRSGTSLFYLILTVLGVESCTY